MLGAIAAIWIALVPVHAAMATVIGLPLVDLALGLVVSYRTRKPITSSGLKRTVAKIFLYEMATVLAFVVESYMTGSLIPCIRMVTGLIGMTELKSCLEHLDSLGGQPLFVTLLGKLAPGKPTQEPPCDDIQPPSSSS